MAEKEDPILPLNTISPPAFQKSGCLSKLWTIFRNKTRLFWWLLIVRLSVLCWSIYVNSRQVSLVYFHNQTPNDTEAFVPEQEYEQARVVHLIAGFCSILGLQLNIILTCVITFFNVLPWVWNRLGAWLECLQQSAKMLGQRFFLRKQEEDYEQQKCDYHAGEVEKSMALVLVLTPFVVIPAVLELPLDAVNLVASVVLFALIAMAVTGLAVFMLKNGGIAMKWLYIWLLFAIMPLILSDVILPLLETRYTIDSNNTSQGYEEMSQLATSVDFPVSSIYVTPEDPQDPQINLYENAYYGGILLNKRIVLSKSIFRNMTSKEITAVLGHELGHWKLGHSIHRFVLLEANILILILLFQRLYRKHAFFKAFGFHEEQPALIFALIFFCFIVPPYQVLVSLASNWLSQFGEYKADAFAATFGLGESLCAGLLKLGTYRTLPMDNDWLYSLSENSHPSTWNRCAALKTD
uniref:Peptidase M48 domain-containing protein n=1 Tax=Ditylenchus dipsaci TaxID=166011 RepID=A0A915CYA7_9BILA